MITPKEIYTALSTNDELTKLLKKVDEITVISYDGTDATWCDALAEYLQKIDKDIECVKKIILFGLGGVKDTWKEIVGKEFPSAEIVSYCEAWNKVDTVEIYIDSPLVLHFAYGVGNHKPDTIDYILSRIHRNRLVARTRILFSAIVYINEQALNINTTSELSEIRIPNSEDIKRSSFCIERENYINQCQNDLNPTKALLLCLEEVKHGCVSCCMVKKYGKVKHCPLAQHAVAQLYQKQTNNESSSLSHQIERLSAYQGYKPACIQMADNLAFGRGCDKDIYAALSIYKRYAYQGDIECCNKIVDLVDKEDSISNLVAVPWMIRQAYDGNIESATRLTRMFTEGLYGLPIDAECTKNIQDIVAEFGDENYINNLRFQAGEREDYAEAIKWSKKLRELESELFDEYTHNEYIQNFINQSNLDCIELYNKGKYYLSDLDVKDIELAEAFIIASAEKGYVLAQERLCFEYYSGSNFIKDFQKSAYWGDKALEQGSKIVRFRIAWLYCGKGNVAPDYEKSFKLYEALAQEGDASAMNNLGWMYESGHYHSDLRKAYECYLKAAEMGDSHSMCNVGNCYMNGIGVEKDQVKAFEWFQKSAAQGHVRAFKQLIHCYKNGIGVEKDVQKVIDWYGKIIEKGEKGEIVNLGHYYETVVLDYEKALHYYLLAAEQGDKIGQYNVGIMYEFGKGVDANENTAIYWYRKSARKGYDKAQEKLEDFGVDWLEENE